MTTLIVTANYCGKTLNTFFERFKAALKRVLVAFMIGRQMSVNRHVAQLLIHEYPDHTVTSLTHMLNEQMRRKDFK
jgi:hypothetical protein